MDNLTPQNVYFGTGQAILEKRQRIKLKTIQLRHALHRQSKAALHQQPGARPSLKSNRPLSVIIRRHTIFRERALFSDAI